MSLDTWSAKAGRISKPGVDDRQTGVLKLALFATCFIRYLPANVLMSSIGRGKMIVEFFRWRSASTSDGSAVEAPTVIDWLHLPPPWATSTPIVHPRLRSPAKFDINTSPWNLTYYSFTKNVINKTAIVYIYIYIYTYIIYIYIYIYLYYRRACLGMVSYEQRNQHNLVRALCYALLNRRCEIRSRRDFLTLVPTCVQQ